MAINYIEKGSGLHRAIVDAGHRLIEIDGVWQSDDDVAVQATIDGYDPLPDVKALKIAELKAEGLRRVQLVMPAIDNLDELKLLREILLSIRTTALQLTADMIRLRDIYQAGVNAVATVNAMTDAAAIRSYNVVTQPGWPA